MPTIRFSRPFASGSRPTPDPFDKFLDSNGLYRKHTPRDSTNLFRVVSEQLYDTQDHYKQVRKDCVNFMIKHRDQYELLVQGDFDEYVREMANNDTFGTLMELRAMGYLFKRNIKLYRPFDLGIWFIEDPEYTEPALHVFHGSHFDSIFKKSYIIKAAFCQSIVYEILYKRVFRLPDIEYSVETMLHSDIIHEPSSHEYENDEYATHIIFEDGRQFQLDRPENTLCILNDPKQCHFHNKNFEELMKYHSKRYEKSNLSDKFCSCVRQLLFDGITPFPYKVAKALDENIYRNVEFDSWNEMRKLARSKQNVSYKVGIDCLVRLNDIEDELFKCRIKSKGSSSNTYVVYIEQLGEKRLVPFTSLRPLNDKRCESIKSRHHDPCAKPISKKASIEYVSQHQTRDASLHTLKREKFDDYVFDYDAICEISKTLDLDSYINLSNFPTNNQQEIIAYPLAYSQNPNMNTNNGSNSNNNNTVATKMKNRNQNSNNAKVSDSNEKQQHQQQQHQMSKADDEIPYTKNVHDTKQESQSGYYSHQAPEQHVDTGTQQPMSGYYSQSSTPVYYCSTSEYNEPNQVYQSEMVLPPHGSVYTIPAYQAPPIQPNLYTPIAGNQMPHYPVHVGNWPAYNQPNNAQGYVFSGPPIYPMPPIPTTVPYLPFLSRGLLRSNGRINFNSTYAYAPNGDDLPLNDKASLKFYYNLGVEYYKLLQQVYGTGQLMAMIDGEPCVENNFDQQSSENESQQNQLVSDMQQMNFESNDNDVQTSPSKNPRIYNEYSYGRRGANPKYKRNDNRPNAGKHFQGSFQGTFAGPTSKSYSKNGQKYMNNQQSASSSYDGTPVKELSGKSHHQGHNMQPKRDQMKPDNEMAMGNNGFGSNVPPYPFHDPNDQHLGPPGNVFPRMTPPFDSRRAPPAIQTIPGYPQVHGNYWMPNPPPNMHMVQPQPQQLQQQSQQQQQQQQPSSQSSLNTSAGSSNPSQ
ncbi:protein ovarian tumor locus-like [Contarinia nasturtii]|uniref:protein ovarian tumor locus-like n=1 Tax=Contarinia nasturtii TaxID=265458 RepID=UPI0012D385D6|nr:protein ovarian tumor locus-like [Contarinia nasturtii]